MSRRALKGLFAVAVTAVAVAAVTATATGLALADEPRPSMQVEICLHGMWEVEVNGVNQEGEGVAETFYGEGCNLLAKDGTTYWWEIGSELEFRLSTSGKFKVVGEDGQTMHIAAPGFQSQPSVQVDVCRHGKWEAEVTGVNQTGEEITETFTTGTSTVGRCTLLAKDGTTYWWEIGSEITIKFEDTTWPPTTIHGQDGMKFTMVDGSGRR